MLEGASSSNSFLTLWRIEAGCSEGRGCEFFKCHPLAWLLVVWESLERAVEKYRPLSPPVIRPAAIRF